MGNFDMSKTKILKELEDELALILAPKIQPNHGLDEIIVGILASSSQALDTMRKETLEEMPEGFVIWKYEGKVYGGQAKFMSKTYVDDYPHPKTKGAKRVLNLISKLKTQP